MCVAFRSIQIHCMLLYLVAALVLGGAFLAATVTLGRRPSDRLSMQVFGFSITYVTLLFGALTLDVLCHLHEIITLRVWLALIAFSFDRLHMITWHVLHTAPGGQCVGTEEWTQ